MLQQAIERVGKFDRAAVIKELQTGTFQTIVGPIKLKDNRYTETWYLGQWQNGEYSRSRAGHTTRRDADLVPKAGMACRVRGQFGLAYANIAAG